MQLVKPEKETFNILLIHDHPPTIMYFKDLVNITTYICSNYGIEHL